MGNRSTLPRTARTMSVSWAEMENPVNWTYRAFELIQTSVAPSSSRWAMGMGSWFLNVRGVIGEPKWKVGFTSFSSRGGGQRRPLTGFSHRFLPWVDSVRASWRSSRMNSLNSFPERLTMLKTSFVVSGQVSFCRFPPVLASLGPGTFSAVCPTPCPPAPPSHLLLQPNPRS